MKIIKPTAFLLFLFTAVQQIHAQKIEFKNYTFSNSKIDIPEVFKNEDEIILEKNRKVEFVLENGESNEYFLFHEKKVLNSNNAVERNNKVYIPYSNKENLIKNKLRVILPDGKILELKDSDIKKETNEQNGVTYEYFAVNGLEKGAIIERFYILKSPAEITGSTISIQGSNPVVKQTLELIYPTNLEFAYKIYNDKTEAEIVTDKYNDKTATLFNFENVSALNDDEQQSNWERNSKAVRYKLNGNKARNLHNLYTHKDFVSSFVDNYFAELSKNEQKDLEKFISKVEKSNDPLIYARNIESLIKENIKYNRYYKLNTNVSDILKSKQGNIFDLIRLYIITLNQLNVDYELVFTTEKNKTYFDPEFESYENIKDVLIYLPSTNTYIEPAATNYRTPLFDSEYGNNYGLFVKLKEYQGVKVPVTKTRKIEFNDKLNVTKMDIVIDARDIDESKFKSDLEFSGYTASYYQIAKDFLNDTDYQELKQDIAKNHAFESTSKPKVTTQNDGLKNLGLKPYQITIDGSAEDLISKAGNNYLIKVGSVIGRQMEMYTEKERQLPIEIEYPHFYTRNITLIIPEGYKIKNPEILNMDFTLTKEGKTVANFVSKYKLEGNKVIINNVENYDFETLPITDYQKYREIINAAADFHKLNLIIETK